MNGNIIAGLVALLFVVTCGVLEVTLLSGRYEVLYEQCVEIIALSDDNKLTQEAFDDFRDNWVDLRELSELLLPHVDVYEINLRFAEAEAYVKQGDFRQVTAQLSVVKELLVYVPHLMVPNWKHIF